MPRKNPTQETVDLTLDGETYTLFFDLDAIAAAEDETGVALIAGMRKRDVDAPRISMVRALFWACLQPYQPKIELPQASAMVNQWNWSEIWEKVLETWVAGMKKPDPNAAADPQKGQS